MGSRTIKRLIEETNLKLKKLNDELDRLRYISKENAQYATRTRNKDEKNVTSTADNTNTDDSGRLYQLPSAIQSRG